MLEGDRERKGTPENRWLENENESAKARIKREGIIKGRGGGGATERRVCRKETLHQGRREEGGGAKTSPESRKRSPAERSAAPTSEHFTENQCGDGKRKPRAYIRTSGCTGIPEGANV